MTQNENDKRYNPEVLTAGAFDRIKKSADPQKYMPDNKRKEIDVWEYLGNGAYQRKRHSSAE